MGEVQTRLRSIRLQATWREQSQRLLTRQRLTPNRFSQLQSVNSQQFSTKVVNSVQVSNSGLKLSVPWRSETSALSICTGVNSYTKELARTKDVNLISILLHHAKYKQKPVVSTQTTNTPSTQGF